MCSLRTHTRHRQKLIIPASSSPSPSESLRVQSSEHHGRTPGQETAYDPAAGHAAGARVRRPQWRAQHTATGGCACSSRGGDYYGAPVNLASRITDVARPGSLLVAEEVKDEVAALYDFSDAGHKHLKGISGTVHLYRCREPEYDEEDGGGGEEDPEPHAPGGRRRSRGRRARKRR